MQEGVLVRYLMTVQDVLEAEYGVSKQSLYSAAGLTALDEFEVSERVSQKYADMFWNTAYLLADDMLGVKVGCAIRYTSYASLGHMLITCKTVDEAVRASCENIAYVGSGAFELEDSSEGLYVYYKPHSEDMPALNQRIEASLLPFCRFAKRNVGGISPKQIWLKRRKPENADIFSNMFHAPVEFGAKRCGLLWSKDALEKAMPDANVALNQLLLSHVKKEMANPFSLTAQLGDLLESRIDAGRFEECTLGKAAKELGRSGRSLQRQLAQEKTSFREELAAARYAKAEFYLLHTRQTVSEIAVKLGYSEPAPFVRFFRKKAGSSPRRFKKEKQGL